MPRITFEAAETQTFEPLPQGTYSTRIDDVRWETAKTSGNQQMRVVMTVTQGAHEGRTLNDWISKTPQTGWKFEQVLKAALADDEYDTHDTDRTSEKGRKILEFEFDSDDLIGAELQVQVTVEDDQRGTPRNRVRYVPAPRTPAKAAAAAATVVEAEPPTPSAQTKSTRRRRTLQA